MKNAQESYALLIFAPKQISVGTPVLRSARKSVKLTDTPPAKTRRKSAGSFVSRLSRSPVRVKQINEDLKPAFNCNPSWPKN